MTAYYSFRAYFRVFHGPVEYHPGDDHHGDDDHGHDDHGHGDGHFHPHAPGWAINAVLAILMIGSLAAAIPYFLDSANHGWVGGLVHNSPTGALVMPDGSQVQAHASHDFLGTGFDPHKAMYFVSGGIGLVGIGLAWWFHLAGRTQAETSRADGLKKKLGALGVAAENKWYVDEIYNALFRVPLLVLANIFYLLDKLLVDGLVDLAGAVPRIIGSRIRPLQSGALQGYAAAMGVGVALFLILAWAAPALAEWMGG